MSDTKNKPTEPYMRMAEKRIPDIKFASDFDLLPAETVKKALLDTVRRGYAMGYRHGVSRRWRKKAKK